MHDSVATSSAADSFTAAQYRILEQVASGAELREILDALVRLIERQAPGMLCTVLLFDAEHQTLHHGAAPSMPPDYVAALDGSAIGPTQGSCGAAAHFQQRVIVEDIATHPFWVGYRELALQHGLRACWSAPILSPENQVLGTFAMYYREPRAPSARELEWVSVATHLAAVAIVRDRVGASLRASEARARQLTRLYAVSSSINEGIVRLREPQQLYEFACRVAVDLGLAPLAWVGIYDERADRIRPIARCGEAQDYIGTIPLALHDERIPRGPSAVAIESGKVTLSNDIANDPLFHWKHEAIERGLRAVAAFPLRLGDARGVLTIYGDRTGFFCAEEVQVLSALADDISFAVASANAERALREREAALRQNEALLRIAGQAARLGGWSVALPAQRVSWSDEVCAIHELPAGTAPSLDEMIGFYVSEQQPLFRNAFSACARDGTPFDLELELQSATHRRVWVRAIGLAERDATGAIVRVNGALQDIGERRELEEQLRQAQKMEAVGQLAGGVAHDFNNLLSVILSYAVLSIEAMPVDEPLRADIDEIRKAADRASELTRQLLAFSRQQVMQPRVLDVNLVVYGVERMLRRLVGDDVVVSVVPAPTVGNVLADPGQLEQVLMNLTVNARDAMPEGGTLTIETANVDLGDDYAAVHAGVTPGPYVRLSVVDTGQGMNAQTRARIFEPFFTTKEKGRGTGLGLSTVWGIVTQSGGHVDVQSEPGAGTRFDVFLPRYHTASDEDSGEADAPSTLRGRETILIVEDEEQVRAVVRAVLQRAGYEVLEAQNGGEAFLICEQHEGRIDLLLTDVVMPRMSGRELADRLLPMRRELRVLYMSGYTEQSFGPRGQLDPSVAFLQKPFAPNALLVKVRELLDRD